MKRFHVHVAVPNLQDSIRFYSTMFGAQPSVVKDDYAKWMLEDPRVNFAISQRGEAAGINHLGFQVDHPSELEEIHGRLQAADAGVTEETNVSCCYARSDKYWSEDPQGLRWETFHTHGDATTYYAPAAEPDQASGEAGACCGPRAVENEKTVSACCGPAVAAAAPSCCN